MHVLKSRAIILRQKGYSLAEVGKELKISKSTASLWLRDVRLPADAKKRLERRKSQGRAKGAAANKASREQNVKASEEFAASALENLVISNKAGRLICSLIYWCEGVKLRPGRTFTFMNSDPNLVRTFLRLLRLGFPIDERKLRLQLHLHDYHDAQKQLLFWSNLTNIPLSQCYSPYIKPHTGTRTRDQYPGCASIRYLDLELGRKIEAIGKLYIQEGP
jgi:predicted transcriptional regulator